MNTIEAVIGHTEFLPTPHLLFAVDGVSLDQILSKAHPHKHVNGLIPTTLGWMESDVEQDEVWRRFTDISSKRIVIPILCCPDDLDFSCSVVVVDAKMESDSVSWVKFGFDTTPMHRLPSGIGSSVDWFARVGPFTFARDRYEAMVQKFAELRRQTQKMG